MRTKTSVNVIQSSPIKDLMNFGVASLRNNTIETEDDALQLTGGTEWPGFYDFESIRSDLQSRIDLSAIG